MSNLDNQNASDFNDLIGALDLEPVTLEPMPFGKFLRELREHPERADTAHGLLIRAIEALGEVDIDKEPLERQPYLRMLKELGITLYKAFDHVRGSQRIAHKQMQHLRAAAQNGYQLFLALIVKGPPGSGKSMFVDAFKKALEGQIVYTVDGCSVHENPLNLLKLLSRKSVNELARMLNLTEEDCAEGDTPSLRQMLAVAGEPCQHCWSAVMENDCEKDPNQALLKLNIVPMRLSSRKFGVSTWTANSSLPSAMETGSRGMVDMGELFDGAGTPLLAPGGPVSKMLLDATNDRRIPAGISGPTQEQLKQASKKDGEPADGDTCVPTPKAANEVKNGYQPLDAVLFGQANEGAWQDFLKGLGKDAGKFTRRFHVFTYPYNTSVTEEEMAYRDRILMMRDQPHFDPMALKLLALLAVISRLKEETSLDLVQKARIYDGEKLEVKRASSSTTTSTGAGKSEYWTVLDLWREAAEQEANTGLDMTVMFNMLSEIIDRSLTDGRFEGCVSSYEMISFLRARMAELEKSEGFTEEQKKALKQCREKFLAVPKSKTEKPGVIETEYRRVLQRQLFEVAAPDFERRAAELFERYMRHANAYATNAPGVEEPETLGGRTRNRTIPVDTKFLNEVDRWVGMTMSSERDAFRASLETQIFTFQREQRAKAAATGIASASDEVTWNTLPKLADGIRKMLNDETRQRLERLLKSQLELQDENEDDRRLRKEMFERFNKLGYCSHCLGQAIEYFKLNELWQSQN